MKCLWICVAMPMLLSACGSAPPSPDRTPAPSTPLPSVNAPAKINLSGFPPEFRQGYEDGCASVKGRQARNELRFKADMQYASGWRDGFDMCKR